MFKKIKEWWGRYKLYIDGRGFEFERDKESRPLGCRILKPEDIKVSIDIILPLIALGLGVIDFIAFMFLVYLLLF